MAVDFILPDPPAEVWLLWIDSPAAPLGGYYLSDFQADPAAGRAYLCTFSRAAAEGLAEYQAERYGLRCRPVPGFRVQAEPSPGCAQCPSVQAPHDHAIGNHIDVHRTARN